jgi:hypothetical protein
MSALEDELAIGPMLASYCELCDHGERLAQQFATNWTSPP